MQVGAKGQVSASAEFRKFLCSAVFALHFWCIAALQKGSISTKAAHVEQWTGTLAASTAPSASLAQEL